MPPSFNLSRYFEFYASYRAVPAVDNLSWCSIRPKKLRDFDCTSHLFQIIERSSIAKQGQGVVKGYAKGPNARMQRFAITRASLHNRALRKLKSISGHAVLDKMYLSMKAYVGYKVRLCLSLFNPVYDFERDDRRSRKNPRLLL